MTKAPLRLMRPEFFAIATLAAALAAAPALAKPELASAPVVAAIAAPASAPQTGYTVTQPFKQLGIAAPIRLRGSKGSSSVPFGMRLDRLASSARLQLRFTASPALLPELSHLKVYVNEQLIGTIALSKEQLGSTQQRSLDFDPRLISDYNHVRFELIGHYTLDCEDPAHTSLWLEIDNASSIDMTLQPLALANDLALLPTPFFDRRDNQPLQLPMVFAQQPSQQLLRAAGVAASWFGALADYRGARFPASLGSLPHANAVVFARNGDRIDGLELTPVDAPTIALRSRPDEPSIKQLVLQGRNDDDLLVAVNALVLGQVVLSGDVATVQKIDIGAARQPYDAPKWVRTDRPVHLGDLVNNIDLLQVRGYTPDPIYANVRLPADLLTTFSRGVPINLKYRYTPPRERDNSTLNININGHYVQTFRLEPSGEIGQRDRVVLPLIDTQSWNGVATLVIPAFQVGSNNQLEFTFGFDQNKSGICRASVLDNMQAALDPDSTIDFTDFPHYMAMPSLSAFANSGFPFTKFADLAQTAVVLPDNAGDADIESMLELMGWMGRWTGLPSLRYQLLTVSQLNAKTADLDLLLVGNALQQSDKLGWDKNLPAVLSANQRKFQPADVALTPVFAQLDPHLDAPNPRGSVQIQSLGDLGAFLSFESPLQSKRTVVAVTGSTAAGLRSSLDALADGGMVSRIRGDIAFVHQHEVSSYQISPNYYVGDLSWWRVVWFHLSRHPVLLALAGVIASIIGAVFLYNTLKRRAERRLSSQA